MDFVKIIDKILENINQLSKKEIGFLYFTKSMTLDKLPEYSKVAEESASKSVTNSLMSVKTESFQR